MVVRAHSKVAEGGIKAALLDLGHGTGCKRAGR